MDRAERLPKSCVVEYTPDLPRKLSIDLATRGAAEDDPLTNGGYAVSTRTVIRFSRSPWHVGVAVLLGLFAGAQGLQAQSHPQSVTECWDCRVEYYQPLDCWIDSCYWTSGAGWSNCSQFGDCQSEETCQGNGHGCEGGLAILLDGRSAVGLSATQLHAILAEAGPDEMARMAWSTEGDTEYLKLSCNGTVIHAEYSRAETARLRLRTHRLDI